MKREEIGSAQRHCTAFKKKRRTPEPEEDEDELELVELVEARRVFCLPGSLLFAPAAVKATDKQQ